MGATTKNMLLCFCARTPLLAIYGLDENRRPYLHVKVYKQRRIFTELVVYGGETKIRCRECFRWHKVIIKSASEAELREVQEPDEVKIQEELHDSAGVA